MKCLCTFSCWIIICLGRLSHAGLVDPTIEQSQSTFEVQGWVFYSIWHRSENTLVGFYGHPSENLRSNPGNIIRLWLEIDPADGSWTSYAVNPADLDPVIDLIDDLHGNSIFVESLEVMLTEGNAVLTAGPSGPMVSGLIEGDPLLPVIDIATDPSQLLDVLAGIGHAAAPSISASLGTTGYSLSPASAQLFDCLRFRIDSAFAATTSCNPCVCETHFVNTVLTPPGTWTVTSTIRNGNRRCTYTRNGTASYYKTGKKSDCTPCTEGSPGAPIGPVPVRENGSAFVDGNGPCPAEPPQVKTVIR